MDLQNFFPYRLAVLAETVSQAMARVYAQRFGLTRDEWRLVAALAELGTARTSTLHEHCTLDKMPASRALASLEAKGLVARSTAPDDRRAHVVQLEPAGRKLMAELLPMVLAREQLLLEALSDDERQLLAGVLGKVQAQAQRLQGLG
ncbi:MAG: transcriptional regulator [Burkholderiales bacterium PBB5]|nr:MAG: transcriptional regulator [Burkholderiales bacterium PBB5]